MELNTDHLSRCIQTLEASLVMLQKTAPENPEYEIFRNAVVKGYELALETAGKLMRKALKLYGSSSRAVDELVFKDVLRLGAKHGLLSDESAVERWFSYRDNRNNTAHDYGIGFAYDTLALMPGFIIDVRALEIILKDRFTHA